MHHSNQGDHDAKQNPLGSLIFHKFLHMEHRWKIINTSDALNLSNLI